MTTRMRVLVLLCLSYAGLSAVDSPARADALCCSKGSQCVGDQLCCDYEELGALPCEPATGNLGYCITTTNCKKT